MKKNHVLHSKVSVTKQMVRVCGTTLHMPLRDLQTPPEPITGAIKASVAFLANRVTTVSISIVSASHGRPTRTVKRDGHWLLYYEQITVSLILNVRHKEFIHLYKWFILLECYSITSKTDEHAQRITTAISSFHNCNNQPYKSHSTVTTLQHIKQTSS
jgi:hypothetical protein